ncbi:hypothetical protein [Rhodopila sp.]|uniref:hypothetical protein n=1 Tax=Rhodopila sp. TaxID=2480087 RepID=UPI003D1453D1
MSPLRWTCKSRGSWRRSLWHGGSRSVASSSVSLLKNPELQTARLMWIRSVPSRPKPV